MDALLTTFVAAALAEWGDKTMLLVVALAMRWRRPAPILAGIAVAALANALIAAAGGVIVHDLIAMRAVSMLVAVALFYAGVAGLIGARPPDMAAGWKTGPFLTAAACFFLLEFGDKTQFLTFSLAARFDSLLLAAFGATAGVLAANLPAALLADRFTAAAPVRPVRIGLAILFLLLGFIVAVNALQLT